jgi:hypothetical protein
MSPSNCFPLRNSIFFISFVNRQLSRKDVFVEGSMFFSSVGWSQKFLSCNFCRDCGHLCFKCALIKTNSFSKSNLYDNICGGARKPNCISIKEFIPFNYSNSYSSTISFFKKPLLPFSTTLWSSFSILSKSLEKVQPYRIISTASLIDIR